MTALLTPQTDPRHAVLFQPLRIGPVTAPNRFYQVPHCTGIADRAPDDVAAMREMKAMGGWGVVCTENIEISDNADISPYPALHFSRDSDIPRQARMADLVHRHGALAGAELAHMGLYSANRSSRLPSIGPSSRLLIEAIEPVQARAMDLSDIRALRRDHRAAAKRAKAAGFDIVYVYASHNLSIASHFLARRFNDRGDDYGGSLENRARLLLDIVKAVRGAVSPQFVVAVKLNSADFQRGGFSPDDAKRVVEMLNPLKVDLVELSGGSYEAPAMQGQARDGRTLAREAYFLEFAQDIATVAQMPLMVTGGIRRKAIAEHVIGSGVAMAGIATALALNPNLAHDWRAGKDTTALLSPLKWKNKMLAALTTMARVKYQLRLLSQGRASKPDVSPLWALVAQQVMTAIQARRYRRLMAAARPSRVA